MKISNIKSSVKRIENSQKDNKTKTIKCCGQNMKLYENYSCEIQYKEAQRKKILNKAFDTLDPKSLKTSKVILSGEFTSPLNFKGIEKIEKRFFHFNEDEFFKQASENKKLQNSELNKSGKLTDSEFIAYLTEESQ